MKRVWLLLAALLFGTPALAVGADAALYDGLLSLLPEDTAYAPGYDEARFRALAAPTSAATALEQLGEPLYRSVARDGTETWVYSRSPSDTHYRERVLHLRGGTVIEKHHEFYVD